MDTGQTFRQAIVAPMTSRVAVDGILAPRAASLVNLMVERSNGEILVMCLLDVVPTTLDLNLLMAEVELALKQPLQATGDSHGVEQLFDTALGLRVSFDNVSLEHSAAGFYANAIGGLASDMAAANGDNACTLAVALKLELGMALAQFTSRIDARIISAITRCGDDLTTDRYNRYCRLGGTVRHRRLQAAEAFPMIGSILIEESRTNAHLRRTVDRQQPLIPALMKAFDSSQEVVRWMMHKDIHCVGSSWCGHIATLVEYLGYLCPEHRPKTKADWDAFDELVTSVGRLTTRISREPKLRAKDITASLVQQIGKLGWSQTKARLGTIGALVDDLQDLSDLIEEVIQVLAEHIGEGSNRTDLLHETLAAPVAKLFCSVGLIRQLQTSLRWHHLMRHPGHISIKSNGLEQLGLNDWQPAYEGMLEIEGVEAVCLTNPEQLRAEGIQMQHCVLNYADYCLYYGSTIISLRQNGQRLSTVELNLSGSPSKALTFEVRQHRGFKNAAAPFESVQALPKLMTTINGRAHAARRQQLYHAMKLRQSLRRERTTPALDRQRVATLKSALSLHVGYERFYEEGLKVASAC
jgi:hypothetical protein